MEKTLHLIGNVAVLILFLPQTIYVCNSLISYYAILCMYACEMLSMRYLLFNFIHTLQEFYIIFCALCLPIWNMRAGKWVSFCQNWFIRTRISGFLYSWSQTCFKIGIAVAGFMVNNFHIIPDLLHTKDVDRSGYFFLNGL